MFFTVWTMKLEFKLKDWQIDSGDIDEQRKKNDEKAVNLWMMKIWSEIKTLESETMLDQE